MTFPNSQKGGKALATHTKRQHCQSVTVSKTSTKELLGSCVRSTFSDVLVCYVEDCGFEDTNWTKLEAHIKRLHTNGAPISSQFFMFPAIISHNSLDVNRFTALPVEDADEDGSESTSASGDSGSLEPATTRASRPITSPLIIPRPTRSRSRPYRRTSPASTRSSSPVLGQSLAVLLASTPVLPSPLGQEPYSRPQTPSEESSEADKDVSMNDIADDVFSMDIDLPAAPANLTGDLDDGESLLPKAGLLLLRLSTLGEFPVPLLLVCIECQCGVPPKSAKSHVASHDIHLTKKEKKILSGWLAETKLAQESKDVSTPRPRQAPLQGLQVQPGFSCKLCPFCAPVKRTVENHVYEEHPERRGSSASKFITAAALQAYFRKHPNYFSQIVPEIDASTLVNAATSVNEIPPLLKMTQWHEHLAPFLTDKTTIHDLCSLMDLPTSKRGDAWLGTPLGNVILDYMKDIRSKANKASLGIKCLLMECPRPTQHGEWWQTLSDNVSLAKYAKLLHRWTHAVIVSMNSHPSGYQFPLTDEIREHAKTLTDILKSTSQEGGVDAFHDFIKLILYPMDRSEDDDDEYSKWDEPIECLLAIDALREDGNFKAAHEITGIFAKFFYHLRGAVLYQGLRNKFNFGNNAYKSVENEAMQNLQPGVLSPYNSCVDYQRYATALALNTNTPPTTRVTADGMFVTFKEHTLDIAKWRHGLHRLAAEIKSDLAELCMGQERHLQIPDIVPDDWTNEVRGYGWTKNARFLGEKRQLLKALLADPAVNLARIEDSKFTFNATRCWDFSNRCDAVLEKILLFAFLTPGQTPRITEFMDHKFANSTRPRSIFRDQDGLWLVTRRVKTETQTRKETFLPIKCHPMLTQFLETYLLLVRPALAELVHHLKGEEAYHVYSEYMWTKQGRRMTEDDTYKILKTFMNTHCDIDVGSHDYRQICVEVGRVFLGSGFEVDQEELDVLASQAGHTASMAQLKYAAEAGRLPSMSSDLLLRYGRISESWWAVTGFKPNTPPMLPLRWRAQNRLSTVGLTASSSDDRAQTSSVTPAFDASQFLEVLTATLTNEIQQVKVGLRDEVRNAVAEALATFQQAVPPTRAPQAVPAAVSVAAPPPSVSATVPADVDDDDMYMPDHAEVLPLPAPSAPSTSSVSSTLLPPYVPAENTRAYLEGLLAKHFADIDHPKFKSEMQMQVVEMALARQENFVAVMPTGSGKSLLFTLPPFNEPGYQTYAVIPNRALLLDQDRKAQNVGLSTQTWRVDHQQVRSATQLVFVAIESATHVKFNAFWLRQENKAIRIVVDEAHQLLTSREFRSHFKDLQRLAQLKVQKIMVTATLAIRLEHAFLQEAGLPLSTRIIRAPCDQPHISFNRITYSTMNTKVVRLAIDVAKLLETSFMAPDQCGIIFVKDHKTADALHANFTQCSTHSVRQATDRLHDENAWREGHKKWIAATTTLIQGIDQPNVQGGQVGTDASRGLLG
ncbi:hypothetical protein BDZ97DRAFT_1925070 [Flammula alnicola]|nr:hypothetical protein BDZ97DRAFT_1925168 [Flammula alnicola]KAF8956907.1 hypothetical protein BDZ97DRAFT_1925070 [Flammula alnicola]